MTTLLSNTACANESLVQPAAFGLHIQRLIVSDRDGRYSSWPPFRFGGWRLWGTYTSWQDLEPKRGRWNFERLDRYVGIAENKNVDIILTFGFTPRWASARPDEPCAFGNDGCSAEPTEINDWEHYVRMVATRYKGRIKYYELWNEPRFSDVDPVQSGKRAGFFSGSTSKLVEMARIAYNVIHEIDPSAKVISPSFDGGSKGVRKLDHYLALGGKDAVDIIGFHFYTTFPELVPELAQELRVVMKRHGLEKKSIWNTEMGYAFARPYLGIKPTDKYSDYMQVISMKTGAEFLARSYILSIASNIERLYWFDWESEKPPLQPMGLSDDGGLKMNAVGSAYKKVYEWLVNSTKPICKADSDSIWSCTLSRGSCMGRILWKSNGTSQYRLPENWQTVQMDRLNGESSIVTSNSVIELNGSPILFSSESGCYK